MTKRIPKSQHKKFTIEVTRKDWTHARLMCRAADRSGTETAERTLADGTKVRAEGVGGNCIIADALINFLGNDTPTTTKKVWFKGAYRNIDIAQVSVGATNARIGELQYYHNGELLVDAFDSEKKLNAALADYNIKLPMKVTFTRSK